MTANSDWLARYNARKSGHQQPPPQQYPQQPVYQPPPPQYPQGYGQPQQPPPPAYAPQPPPPVYAPQPIPGAPPHAPFGYDPTTGTPLSPYGRDQYGNVIVQPQPYYQQPPPQQPMHDERGQVLPQGYGQPPYGAPAAPRPPTEFDPNTGQQVVHAMDAAAHYQGGKGQRATQCPECDGHLIPTDATGESRVLNVRTGEFAYPAAHCNKCGYNGAIRPGESVAALSLSGGVQVVGQPRPAPGGGSLAQVAGQHGMPNLFAPKAS